MFCMWPWMSEDLTNLLYSFTWSCRMPSRKVKILSIFCVRVCWISRRLWVGNVWNVITSSANRSRTSITSSVWASWREIQWLFIQIDNDYFTSLFTKSAWKLVIKYPMNRMFSHGLLKIPAEFSSNQVCEI